MKRIFRIALFPAALIVALIACMPALASGGAARLLKRARLQAASLSPDGKRLVYQTNELLGSSATLEISGMKGVMYVREVSPQGHPKAIGNGFRPLWSPVGDDIAFIAQNSLWVCHTDGSQRRLVYEGTPTRSTHPLDLDLGRTGCREVDRIAWSPDAAQIAFILAGCYFNERRSLWVVNAHGQAAHMLVDDLQDVPSLTWSPNGKLIAFNENRQAHGDVSRTSSIKTLDIASGQLSTLASDTFSKLGAIDQVTFMADGKLVAGGVHNIQGPTLWEVLPDGTSRAFLTTKDFKALGMASKGGSLEFAVARDAPRMLLGRFQGHGEYDLWVIDLPPEALRSRVD
jgi:Tol biopolymer transport system component